MKKRNPFLIAGFVLLGLVVIATLFFIFRSNKPKVTDVQPTTLVEGKNEVVYIKGRNFPELSRIKVNFGGVPGFIQMASKKQLTVKANIEKMKINKPFESFMSNMVVSVNDKSIKTTSIRVELDKKIMVTDYSPKVFWTGSTVTFQGKKPGQQS